MKIVVEIEHSASSSRGKHEGESSFALCDRLSRTRDNSQRQLPTDHDYAVSTREYQTDGSVANLGVDAGVRGVSLPARQAAWSLRFSPIRATASASALAPMPKARSTMRASPRMLRVRLKIAAWPLRRARITSNPLIVA